MLANGLIFLLGTLVATLVALVLAPILWRKAQSLARRDFEATIPISANEIRAEFDRVRAEAALTVRRQEVLSAETRAKAAKVQADLGRSIVENTELQARNRSLMLFSAERDKDMASLRSDLGLRDEEVGRLSKEVAEVRHESDLNAQELEALARRFRELGAIAEERKTQLVAAETRLEHMADSLRASERDGRDSKAAIERLQDEIEALNGTLVQERSTTSALHDKVAALVGRLADREEDLLRHAQLETTRRPEAEPPAQKGAPAATATEAHGLTPDGGRTRGRRDPSPASDERSKALGPNGSARLRAALAKTAAPAAGTLAAEADLRERISDIAARVIRMTALAEGPGSPLQSLIAAPDEKNESGVSSDGAEAATNAPPTLAERVRRLAEAERAGGAPARLRASGE